MQEASNGVAWLGTASKPILDAVGVQFDFRRVLQRVVRSHDLYSPAIAGLAFVQYHNPVKRVLFLADPSQTNCQHEDFLLPEIIAGSNRLRYPASEKGPYSAQCTQMRYRGQGFLPSQGLRCASELAKALEPALGCERAVLLHHLAHLQVLLQHLIHLLHGGAAAACDPLAAFAINHIVVVAFGRRHRVDDGLDALQARFVDLHVLWSIRQRAYFRQHAKHLLDRPHLADLAQLVAEVFQSELASAQLPFELRGLL